eukprot:CAMPEP_0184695428 /NCGR_PEP_ID=MMETSP0313-20130426/3049_1 /TAXON_ID=2792 /ORGANISM="Porphyridium aerugineum, Strain SAG 1380-2" /LENGTH=481 /DNA_ID=CAMNT_0027153873 /DNA_START=36 /DNA_END=1478 /DNA_ORIENTATION=-
MAGIFPPTLLVGVIALFIYARVQHLFFLFERLLFGLLYVRVPSAEYLMNALFKRKDQASGKSGTGTTINRRNKNSKNALTIASKELDVELVEIDSSFFVDPEVGPRPLMVETGHILAISCVTMLVAMVEEILSYIMGQDEFRASVYPFSMSLMGLVLYELARISIRIKQFDISMLFGALAFIFSWLIMLADRDKLSIFTPIHLERGMKHGAAQIIKYIQAVKIEDARLTSPVMWIWTFRIVLTLLCALITMMMLVPSLRFAKLFYAMLKDLQEQMNSKSKGAHQESTQAIHSSMKPGLYLQMFLLILDFALPIFISLTYLKPVAQHILEIKNTSNANLLYALRIVLVLNYALIHLVRLRPFMQAYFDTSFEHISKTMSVVSSAASSSANSGGGVSVEGRIRALVKQLYIQITSIHVYACTTLMLYVAPCCIHLALAMLLKRHGGVSLSAVFVKDLSQVVDPLSLSSEIEFARPLVDYLLMW